MLAQPTALLETAIVAGALACGPIATIAALRARARSRADRLELRLALAREVTFVEAARRLADAAGTSIEAVRVEIDRAVRLIAPGIDAVMFFEERDGHMACVAAFGERIAYYAGARLALDDECALPIRALLRAHRVTTRDEPDVRMMHPGDGFAAAVPLVLETGRKCVLYAGTRTNVSSATIDRVVTLVDQATPAYRIACERADDRARAEFDGLTGLLTPRAFRARFADAIERARYAPLGRVALLFVDTDRFKAWNDTYGHASGDALLRELALILRAVTRHDDDLVARNGGDEFCVVLNEIEKSRAIEIATHLRRRIAAADFSALRPPAASEVAISASIGIACFPADAATPNELLEKADEAMYFSKHGGRDAVSYFGVGGVLVRAEETAPARS